MAKQSALSVIQAAISEVLTMAAYVKKMQADPYTPKTAVDLLCAQLDKLREERQDWRDATSIIQLVRSYDVVDAAQVKDDPLGAVVKSRPAPVLAAKVTPASASTSSGAKLVPGKSKAETVSRRIARGIELLDLAAAKKLEPAAKALAYRQVATDTVSEYGPIKHFKEVEANTVFSIQVVLASLDDADDCYEELAAIFLNKARVDSTFDATANLFKFTVRIRQRGNGPQPPASVGHKHAVKSATRAAANPPKAKRTPAKSKSVTPRKQPIKTKPAAPKPEQRENFAFPTSESNPTTQASSTPPNA